MSTTTQHTETLPPQDTRKRPKILVIGDWSVDEHWVTGLHRSPTRSRPSDMHHRALHSLGSTVDSLGGAGRVASLLHRNDQTPHEPLSELFVVGLWHHDDEKLLAQMLDPARCKGETPHRVQRVRRDQASVKDVRMFNLRKILPLTEETTDATSSDTEAQRRDPGTIRVTRIYQRTGGEFLLVHRIDWECPVEDVDEGWVTSIDLKSSEGIRDQDDKSLSEALKDVEAVVVKDMRKGVVTETTVRWLNTQLKTLHPNPKAVKWFISSKGWLPTWVEQVPADQVKLFMLPQVPCQRAIGEDITEGMISSWFTRKGEVSGDALRLLTKKFGEKFPNALVVALPKGFSVIARRSAQIGWVQSQAGKDEAAELSPMASVYFPALIYEMLRSDNRRGTEYRSVLESSLTFTLQWARHEWQRFQEPVHWNPSTTPALRESSAILQEPPGEADPFGLRPIWREIRWFQEERAWSQANEDLGIISRTEIQEEPSFRAHAVSASHHTNAMATPPTLSPALSKIRRVIEPHRGMTDVDGYVCCIETRRKHL